MTEERTDSSLPDKWYDKPGQLENIGLEILYVFGTFISDHTVITTMNNSIHGDFLQTSS